MPQSPLTAYSRKLYQRGIQTFSWKADDPNGDTLSYDVYYRPLGDTRLRALRKGLTDTVLAWDTSTVPNGRYVVRVTADDAPSNPEALALTADKESAPFDVDNTPPVVTASLLAALAGARARDRARRQQPRAPGRVLGRRRPLAGGPPRGRHQRRAGRDLRDRPPAAGRPGPHVLVVRATDLLGNVATARVEVP